MEAVSSTVLPIQENYSMFLKIFIPIVTIYCGLFMALSNHYVLKPKIQTFLFKASISSNVIRELIIDFLSSLSLITLLLSSLLLTPTRDEPLVILSFHDNYWTTIFCALLVYWKIPEQQNSICMKTTMKNIIFLLLCYCNTLYHYFTKTFYFTLGLVYIGLYLLNLLINSYEDRFINFINELLGLKNEQQKIPFTERTNKLPTYGYLAENYLVSKSQLNEKLAEYQKRINIEKINTKAFATKKLLQIALAINLSRKKMEKEEKNFVCQYFGSMNGTIKRQAKGPFAHTTLKETKKDFNKQVKNKEEDEEEDFEENLVGIEESQDTSILFYVFPVKLFESSKIISTLFSVFINLGFGLLLDYCSNITNTFQYGTYFYFIYAFLLLPILPKISSLEYFNNMVLFSLWKYCLAGIIYSSSSSMNGLTWSWETNPALKYHTIIQALSVIISTVVVLVEKKTYKALVITFFVGLGINVGLVYFKDSLP